MLCIIEEIDGQGVVVDIAETQENEWIDLFQFTPIHLTEEWLLKFGFEIAFADEAFKEALYGDNPVTEDYLIILKNVSNYWFYRNGHFKIRYVHQLQNLFFALTGEELTIKS